MRIAVLVSYMQNTGHPLETLELPRNPAKYDSDPNNQYEIVPIHKSTAEKQIVALRFSI